MAVELRIHEVVGMGSISAWPQANSAHVDPRRPLFPRACARADRAGDIRWKGVIKGDSEIDVCAIPDRKGGQHALHSSVDVSRHPRGSAVSAARLSCLALWCSAAACVALLLIPHFRLLVSLPRSLRTPLPHAIQASCERGGRIVARHDALFLQWTRACVRVSMRASCERRCVNRCLHVYLCV